MSNQPEAMRLADALEVRGFLGTTASDAAAELRRLSAVEDEWARMSQDEGKFERETERLRTVNQELLGALKLALSAHGVLLLSDPPQDAWKTYGVEQKARAAIAKAEGQA
jgi:hypothetical protein